MPDPSTTGDPIRTAFAELRSSAQTRTTPPGVAAAYRTVRRRRRLTAAGGSAGLTAVVLLAAGYLAGAATPGPDRTPPEPAAAQSAEPTASGPDRPDGPDGPVPDPESRRLAELAQDGLAAATPPPSADGFRAVTGWSGLGHRDPADYTRPGIVLPAPAGEYLVRVGCGGTGSVSVTIAAGGAQATATAQCATTTDEVAAGSGEATLTLDADSEELQVTTEPDDAALSGGVWVTEILRAGP